jgi:tetratricopeptide (TPR) repeat protein
MKFCGECGARLQATRGTATVAEMLAEYAKRVADKPADADAQYNLGLARLYQGQFEAAREAFAAVIELEPEFADAHLRLAECCVQLGRREEALTALQRAAELAPSDAKIREALQRLGKP